MCRIDEKTRHSGILPKTIRNVELVSVELFTVQKSQPIDSATSKKENPLNIAGLQLVPFYFLHQSRSIEMKEFSRFVFNPFGFLEGLQYQ